MTNIKECEFYKSNSRCDCGGYHYDAPESVEKNLCEENSNCHYKQLLASKQENELFVKALQKISEDFNKSHHKYCYIAKDVLEQTNNWFIEPIALSQKEER